MVLSISLSAAARGYNHVWNDSISNLGWYGQEVNNQHANGHQHRESGEYLSGPQQQGYTYPNVTTFGGSQPVYQLPGHSVVITQGPNGQESWLSSMGLGF